MRCSNEPEKSDCRTFDGSLTSVIVFICDRKERRGKERNSFEVHLNHSFHILLRKFPLECELRWRPSSPTGFPVIMKWEQEIRGVRDVEDGEGGGG